MWIWLIFTPVDPSRIGELCLQAMCYVYVLWPRSIMLKQPTPVTHHVARRTWAWSSLTSHVRDVAQPPASEIELENDVPVPVSHHGPRSHKTTSPEPYVPIAGTQQRRTKRQQATQYPFTRLTHIWRSFWRSLWRKQRDPGCSQVLDTFDRFFHFSIYPQQSNVSQTLDRNCCFP